MGADAPGVGGAPAIVDADVAAVAPAELFERLPERRQSANPAWLLRVRRGHRPSHRAPEQRHELAPRNHSITSSARASSVAGTSRPSDAAVFKLITSSCFVGAWTGRSAGFSPFRMRST